MSKPGLSQREPSRLKVVLFSGGRGSGVLTKQLVVYPRVTLTVAINGYDDGASTGEVRRFLGDGLGPSDFRKNASRLASELKSCSDALIAVLDYRLPAGCTRSEALAILGRISNRDTATSIVHAHVVDMAERLTTAERRAVGERLDAFERELAAGSRVFDFSDCSVGNLVFAGSFLQRGRVFNDALADYCALVGLPPGMIENVTDGTNAFLVAIDVSNRVVGSEEEIVDAKRRNSVQDIYLLRRPLTSEEATQLTAQGPAATAKFLKELDCPVAVNARLVERIAAADLIVYAPGTQHSSLFPSYLTPGLSSAIAGNLTAMKLLITNIQSDAEISGASAVDIIDRALYYLKEKGRLATPTPCLITHYLINDPGRVEKEASYVPLGRLESFEDPRLVRIGHYEEGITGRHDAAKLLTPFIESLLAEPAPPTVAILLCDTGSINKLCQTLLEFVRGGLDRLRVRPIVFVLGEQRLDADFTRSLPFEIRSVPGTQTAAREAFLNIISGEGIDYVALFESSGMYNGEDLVSLASYLTTGRLDSVWGSRRLSVRDIEESYRLRYRERAIAGAISYIGSHLLSLLYLFLYGRYVSDTLSGVRVVRSRYMVEVGFGPTPERTNQRLLSAILRQKGEMLETPVQFFSLSPSLVRRTSVLGGLRSVLSILWWRFKPLRARTQSAGPPASVNEPAAAERAAGETVISARRR